MSYLFLFFLILSWSTVGLSGSSIIELKREKDRSIWENRKRTEPWVCKRKMWRCSSKGTPPLLSSTLPRRWTLLPYPRCQDFQRDRRTSVNSRSSVRYILSLRHLLIKNKKRTVIGIYCKCLDPLIQTQSSPSFSSLKKAKSCTT